MVLHFFFACLIESIHSQTHEIVRDVSEFSKQSYFVTLPLRNINKKARVFRILIAGHEIKIEVLQRNANRLILINAIRQETVDTQGAKFSVRNIAHGSPEVVAVLMRHAQTITPSVFGSCDVCANAFAV